MTGYYPDTEVVPAQPTQKSLTEQSLLNALKDTLRKFLSIVCGLIHSTSTYGATCKTCNIGSQEKQYLNDTGQFSSLN